MSLPEAPQTSAINFFFNVFKHTERNCILLMDRQGVILCINRAFTLRFGYEESDLVGKRFDILFTHKDQLAGMPNRELQQTVTTGRSGDNNALVRKDGSVVWVSGESVIWNLPHEICILKIVQDIDKHHRQEIESNYLKNFNENILSTIEEAVLVIDENRQIIQYNQYYKLLFGRREPEVCCESLLNLIEDERTRSILDRQLAQTIEEGREFKNFEVTIRDDAGKPHFFEIAAKPLATTARDKTVLIVLHNISLLKQLQMQAEDVLGFVAHELRNPITNLNLTCELMEMMVEEGKTAEIRRLLDKANANVQRVSRLVRELNSFTRMAGNEMVLEVSCFPASDVVYEALETIQGLHPDFTIEVLGKVERKIEGDKFRLIQVMTNYLSNAVKYSDKEKKIVIHMEENSWFKVSVTDRGIGISREALPHIFTRFYRTFASRNLEGLGLGLYLVKRIIESHGGRVYIESVEGQGSTFGFEVPFKR